MNPTTTRNPRTPSAIERASLADAAYEALLEAIVSGQLAAGSSLNSVQLANQLEISRTPVQEAIRRLVSDGLAEQKIGYQARVVALLRTDIEEIYQQRMLLESAAAERAAGRIPPAQIAEWKLAGKALLDSQDDLDWPARVIEYDVAFHDAIAAACGNERLTADVRRYRLLIRGLCRMTGTREVLRSALVEHGRIVAALAAQNGPAAKAAMVAHIEARLATVLKAIAK